VFAAGTELFQRRKIKRTETVRASAPLDKAGERAYNEHRKRALRQAVGPDYSIPNL
jgi:hypothetical protein